MSTDPAAAIRPVITDPVDPIDVLARTLYGEARGEDRRGRELVANVIMNRVNADLGHDGKPDWWGEGVVAVCLKPHQFSCWLPADPNRDKIMAVTATNPLFAECLEIAAAAIAGTLPDYSNGATHYLNPLLTQRLYGLPDWAKGREPLLTYGRHSFYRAV